VGAGATGPAGADGATGPAGADGADGAAGADGAEWTVILFLVEPLLQLLGMVRMVTFILIQQ
jgi:hypothetical protein